MSNGLPIVAVLFNSSFALLSYMGIKTGGSGQVFLYLSQMASIAGLVNWFGIAVTYLRFYNGMKAQGYVRSELPYYSKFQPFAAWYAVCSIIFIMLVSHFFRFSMDWFKL
jgi:amino acid transporter